MSEAIPPSSLNDLQFVELQRFRLLVEAISDYAIYMLGIDGTVISWNEGARRFKGYEPYEIIGKNFSRFYALEDQSAGLPQRALHQAETTGKFEGEGWRYRKDGTRFWATVVIDSIRDREGKLLGFAKITRDITERKEAAEALRLSEQQFRFLVQGVTDYAIYMLDQNGIISNWNAGAARIKGYERSEVVGTHFSRFYTAEDQKDGRPAYALASALATGHFEQEGFRVRKDGTQFMAHVVIDPIYDDLGNFIGFAKVTRDISEKVEAAAALRKTEIALQQSRKLETIGKLTGGIAHDFNNLLQVISGNLHLLSKELGDNDGAQNRIARALTGVSRGAKLSNQLLAFGRRQPLEPKVVNLGKFLNNFQDMVARTIGESIETEVMASAGLWNAMVDLVQIENAVLNLAINARDAMDGVGKLTIEVGNAFLDDDYARNHSDVVAGQYVMLAVTDTGSGMTPEIAAQAFEPFFSTKPEGKGTGLGLSMVYGFVKQSGGHIKIYSEVGEGTAIKLYLPRTFEVEDFIEVEQEHVVIGGSETILVAEDDEQVRGIVVDMLKELGYQVLKAPDAQSAFSIIESGIKIDMLFTDVVMPGSMRSPDLARKARERQPNIAVLFTSGYTQNAIVHGGRLDPGVELLNKPYTREALARKVRDVLANQKHKTIAALKESPPASGPLFANATSHPSLTILLVEDDEFIRQNTVELLQHMGHQVFQAGEGKAALDIIGKEFVDVLITDINLPNMSGTAIASAARHIRPNIQVIYASGDINFPAPPSSVLLRKPYDEAAIAAALGRLY
ncbi:MAG: PAS domain S-box protein [Herminiimonas sp.]|uniref:hybrid sensor histidine kinase/response regulator n=1 Tax=Herminiimonas sp. TaxID=1926289 RepID=UPI0027270224|nr:PAS domain S-box protein [Herminiimonas sp.]MDO9419262.1 PAS domain S-box protein [Herminiimonas sp.]